MLAYVLALLIGLGSLAIYAAAFLLPVIHRKSDFIWSGVGLFYALVLWVCAGQIRGGLLLGQTASVALLGWFGWQTLKLRWDLLPIAERSSLSGVSSTPERLKNTVELGRKKLTALLNPAERSQLQQPVKLTNLQEGGQKSPSPNLERQTFSTPTAPEMTGAVPEYELVEPEPLSSAAPAVPATPPTVPVPSVQPSTGNRTKPAPATSPIETAKAILVSLKEGGQQFWRNIAGRKPKRPTIVLDRTKPTAAPPAPPEPLDDNFDDFDFETEAAILNNEVELAATAAAAVVPSEVVASETIAVDDGVGDPVEAVAPELVTEPAAVVPELVRPNPPDPELVAEAVADAEVKNLPADPPTPEPAYPDDSEEINSI